jgi:hypothetical protein
MLARSAEDRVDDARVVPARLRLELLPVDGNLESVDAERLRRRPDLGKDGRPGARVVALRAEDEKRLTVDDQGVAPVLLHEVGQRRVGGPRGGRREQAGDGGQGRQHSVNHRVLLFSYAPSRS